MKQIFFPLLALVLAQQTLAASSADRAENVLLTVNEIPVSELMLQLYAADRKIQPADNPEAQKQQRIGLVNEMINTVLLSEQASKEKLDEEPTIREALELARRKILTQAAITKHLQSFNITEEQIRDAYDRGVERLADKNEYHTSHILLDTEQAANQAISRLNNGEDFAKLAKEVSTDPTNSRGGDLGWLAPQNMQPEFAAAVLKLGKGAYTGTPIKTSFGWHVIQLQDTRTPPTPKLEDVRDGIITNLKKQQLQQYVNELRQQAKIEVKNKADN
ncbi:MAG: peptidylprolyl isomerase [Chromatiales bacterium]|jgi:peptidyl-prolyl cis-trans isomerase C